MKKLNPQQRAAVNHRSGPLLIIAGAGTGKTTVLTERITRLIVHQKLPPDQFLALTFTEKAAREMEDRVDRALPYGYTEVFVSTFHAFCDRVLRDEATAVGLDSAYKLLSQSETIQFLTDHLFELKLNRFRPLGNPSRFVEGLLAHFSRLKDEDLSPQAYLSWAKRQRAALNPRSSTADRDQAAQSWELARAFVSWEKLKIKAGVMDFSDLVGHVLRLFRHRPAILRRYRDRFRYLLIDEFQDTNRAQNALAILLAGPQANLTVCADDDQSIYRFRGAAISNVLEFRAHYPQAKIVVLKQNYRSSQRILDAAYRLIRHNDPDRLEVREKIDKRLVAVSGRRGKPVGFFQAARVEEEADWVAGKIFSLHTAGYRWRDFAVLVRANNQADPFLRALGRRGIPFQFLGPGKLFRQEEIKDLIAYLQLLYDPEDNVAAYRVLSSAIIGFSGRELAAINSFGRRQNLSLFQAAEKGEEIFLSASAKEKLARFVQMVDRHLDLVPRSSAGQILYYFLADSGLLKKLTTYDTPQKEKEAQNIARFFDRLKTYETNHEDASVFAVVNWLNLSLRLKESPLADREDWEEADRVNLLTVHSAKGLEFPVVFLINLVKGRFPTYQRSDQIPIPEALLKTLVPSGDFHLQEERRLFYVGLTRAKERLFLTAARFYGEGKRERGLSPFVVETLGVPKLTRLLALPPAPSPADQLAFFDWSNPPVETSPAKITPVNYLSFSQLSTFETCPLQYRYRYLQKIPVPPAAAQNFGSVLHLVLNRFYQLEKPDEKQLLALLDDCWLSGGYQNRRHEEKMRLKGRQLLRRFYRQYDPQTKVKDLEKTFIVKLGPDFKVGGRIDRIDDLGAGRLEIIDYKSGQVWEQKKIDQSWQMTLYALALADPRSNLFCQPDPAKLKLSFYFLGTGEKKTTVRSLLQLKRAGRELLTKKDLICRSHFPPQPGIWCDFCDFRLICQAWD